MSLKLAEGWFAADDAPDDFHYLKLGFIDGLDGTTACGLGLLSNVPVYPLAERPPFPLVCPDCLKAWERDVYPKLSHDERRAIRYVGR